MHDPQHILHRQELEGHGFGARRLDIGKEQVVIMLFYLVASKAVFQALDSQEKKYRGKKLKLERQRVASCVNVMKHMVLCLKEKAIEQLAGHASAQSQDLIDLEAMALLYMP